MLKSRFSILFTNLFKLLSDSRISKFSRAVGAMTIPDEVLRTPIKKYMLRILSPFQKTTYAFNTVEILYSKIEDIHFTIIIHVLNTINQSPKMGCNHFFNTLSTLFYQPMKSVPVFRLCPCPMEIRNCYVEWNN